MAALDTAGKQRGASGLLKAYIATWATLSVGAVCYLAVMAVQPELITAHFPGLAQDETDAEQNRRAIARLAIEAQTLRSSLADLQRDIAEVKSTVRQDSDQDKAIFDRLAAMEEQTRRATETGRMDLSRAGAGTEPPPAPPVRPKVVTAPPPASAQIETGAIAPPISFGPAVVTPVRTGPVAIHLSKWPSLDAVRLAWAQLSEQHSSALNRLEPRFKAITAGSEAPAYQLLAGPVASAEEGGRICAVLRVKRVGCRVGQLEGDAL